MRMDREKERERELKKLIVTFRNFSKEPLSLIFMKAKVSIRCLKYQPASIYTVALFLIVFKDAIT
jgi:hypothetical protein